MKELHVEVDTDQEKHLQRKTKLISHYLGSKPVDGSALSMSLHPLFFQTNNILRKKERKKETEKERKKEKKQASKPFI